MGKSDNYVVVLWIGLTFGRMVPMGVKNKYTKYELETQRWRPGTGVANGQPRFQNLQFRVKSTLFLPQTTLKLVQITQMKGNGGHTLGAT